MGYEKTSAVFVGNGVAMAITFFLVRIAVMPSYWSRVYTVYDTPAFNRLGYIQLCLIIPCVILDVINIYWFYKICSGAFKVCRMFYAKEQKNAPLKASNLFTIPFNNFKSSFTKQSMVPTYTGNHKHIDWFEWIINCLSSLSMYTLPAKWFIIINYYFVWLLLWWLCMTTIYHFVYVSL